MHTKFYRYKYTLYNNNIYYPTTSITVANQKYFVFPRFHCFSQILCKKTLKMDNLLRQLDIGCTVSMTDLGYLSLEKSLSEVFNRIRLHFLLKKVIPIKRI